MEEILIGDNWKKERKTWIYLMIFTVVVGVLLTVTFWFDPVADSPVKSILPIVILFGGFFLIAVYGFVYCSLYAVTVTQTKLTRKSLFGSAEVLLSEVQGFTLQQYNKKSELYLFNLNVNGKNIKVYTRYYQQLKELLESKNN